MKVTVLVCFTFQLKWAAGGLWPTPCLIASAKLGFPPALTRKVRNECSRVALRSSHFIYLRRAIDFWRNMSSLSSSKSTLRSPATCCLSNDVSVWVAPAFIKSKSWGNQDRNAVAKTIIMLLVNVWICLMIMISQQEPSPKHVITNLRGPTDFFLQ